MSQGVASPVFTPGRLGPIELHNRVVKCATNEGLSRVGMVTDPLIDWHRQFAAGGVGMTTLAYCSVAAEGRTFGDQIWIRGEALDGLRRFAEAMHAEGAKAGIQLTHAGWFAYPRATGTAPVGPSRMFSPHAQTFSRAMTERDFEAMTAEWGDAARLAAEAGFDALEIHMGHGYLLNQFLSPYHNRRKDHWGGSLTGRARFPRQVLRAVREAAGPGVAVYAKLNMSDGFRGGLELHESLEMARMLEADGFADALQLTGGHTSRTPMFLLRGELPLRDMIRCEPDRVRRLALRIAGPLLIRPYPFEEAFFRPWARQFRAEVKLPLMLLGGVTRLDTMNRALEEGFEFVAVGRALIREPDLVLRMQAGQATDSLCNQCNKCVAEMQSQTGTRCVLRPGAPPAD